MKKRFVVAVCLGIFLAVLFAVPNALADGGKGQYGKHMGFEDKFYKKAYTALVNKKELDLSDEQVEKIKKLKVDTKKDIIMKSAEIDVLVVEIKASLWEDTIDTAALDKLIDKKYELKKAKAKGIVAAYATLKNILTEEQKEELTELCAKNR